MKDIPIIFSGPMVRALLAGRKTMTRRLFKPDRDMPPAWDGRFGFSVLTPDRHVELRGVDPVRGPLSRFMKMKYAKDDRLWVRETVACGACAPSAPSTWAPSFWRREQGSPENRSGLWYQADGLSPRSPITERGKWTPSIHMPRWASRLTLIVTGTKVERLMDITDADAKAEGIAWCNKFEWWHCDPNRDGAGPGHGRSASDAFLGLWAMLHGDESIAENPFVVAVSFRVVKANIDAAEARAAA